MSRKCRAGRLLTAWSGTEIPYLCGFSRPHIERHEPWASDDEMTALATPATVPEGEITVASKDELHAAPLSGKRLLAPVERSLTGSPSAESSTTDDGSTWMLVVAGEAYRMCSVVAGHALL